MEIYLTSVADQKFREGVRLQNECNYVQAIEHYTAALKYCGGVNPEYYGRRAECARKLHDYKSAISDAKQAILADHCYRNGYVTAIQCALIFGNIDDASETIESYRAQWPNDMALLNNEIKMHQQLQTLLGKYKSVLALGHYLECVDLLDEALEVSPECTTFRLQQVRCLIRAPPKHLAMAMQMVKFILRQDNFNAEAHHVLGLIYYQKDELAQALKCFEVSLQNDQEFAEAQKMRALVKSIRSREVEAADLIQKNDISAAFRLYQQILLLVLHSKSAIESKMNYNCGLMSYKLGKFQNAVDYFTAAIEIYPDYYEAYWKRAESNVALNRLTNALDDCLAAYEMVPASNVEQLYTEISARLGSSATEKVNAIQRITDRVKNLMMDDDYTGALRHFNQLHLLKMNNADLSMLQCMCLIWQGHTESAKELLNSLGRQPSADKTVIETLQSTCDQAERARSGFHREQYQESLESLAKIDINLPLHFQLLRAECLVKMHQFEEAQSLLHAILKRDNTNDQAISLQGIVYFDQMKFSKARNMFVKCRDAEASELLKRVKATQILTDLGYESFHMELYLPAYHHFQAVLRHLLHDRSDSRLYHMIVDMVDECDDALVWLDARKSSVSEFSSEDFNKYLIQGDIHTVTKIKESMRKSGLLQTIFESVQKAANLESLVNEGISKFEANNFASCIQSMEAANGIARESIYFTPIIVECQILLQNFRAAEKMMERVSSSSASADLYLKALLHYFQNELSESLKLIHEFLPRNKDNLSAQRIKYNIKMINEFMAKGDAFIRTGDFNEAQNTFTTALKIDEANVRVNSVFHFKSAESNYALGHKRDCIRDCKNALKLNSNYHEAQELMDMCQAEILPQTGSIRRNERLLSGVIATTSAPDVNAGILKSRTTLVDNLNLNEGAPIDEPGRSNKQLMAMMQHMNDEEKSDIRAAITLFNDGRYDECLQDIEKLSQRNDNELIQILRVRCLLKLFRIDQATRVIAEFTDSFPASPSVLYLHGLFAYYNEDYENAVIGLAKFQDRRDEIKSIYNFAQELVAIRKNREIVRQQQLTLKLRQAEKDQNVEFQVKLHYQLALLHVQQKRVIEAIESCASIRFLDSNFLQSPKFKALFEDLAKLPS